MKDKSYPTYRVIRSCPGGIDFEFYTDDSMKAVQTRGRIEGAQIQIYTGNGSYHDEIEESASSPIEPS